MSYGSQDWADLVREIRTDPGSEEPRLIAADYLIERNDPRGEYIVVKSRLDAGVPSSKYLAVYERYRELAHEADWSKPLGALGAQPLSGFGFSFRHGFVEEVRFVDHTIANLAAACRLEPITGLVVEGRAALHPDIPLIPELGEIVDLLIDASCARLLASPFLGGVRSFAIKGLFTPDLAAMLADSVVRPHRFAHGFGLETARVLVESNALDQLREVVERGETDEDLELIARSPLAHLRLLELTEARVTVRSFEALGPRLDQLEVFRFDGHIDRELATVLVKHMPSGRLRELRLASTTDDERGVID
nr:hypothetical protein [Deltaproteobacteria bacterium]